MEVLPTSQFLSQYINIVRPVNYTYKVVVICNIVIRTIINALIGRLSGYVMLMHHSRGSLFSVNISKT